jgi:hypothetical protein
MSGGASGGPLQWRGTSRAGIEYHYCHKPGHWIADWRKKKRDESTEQPKEPWANEKAQ